ncbi:DUF4233 domain-containing protein [Saxibacter everestensis]|uniref:DUF4233 domain-containing protein n=1 Tax=Saxibacter everestensis TaxID=2909229 RepID=A0ABY8R0L6_9MICO|nr:DUF4233 domain-containing protein [Brevibacteriaceae bacterium ZFBP1038]
MADKPAAARSTKRMFASATLVFELGVVFFAVLVAFGLRAAPVSQLAIGGGAIVLLCLFAASLLRHRLGYWLGWLAQLAILATGILIPMMFLVGALFTATWAFGLYWGARIDREKRARADGADGAVGADGAGL